MFSDLVGKKLLEVEGQAQGEEMLFHVLAGGGEVECYRMYHSQDCCESVYVESIVGDLNDMRGAVVLEAEESSKAGKTEEREYGGNSCTWTFYKLRTNKGYLDIRWVGTSNGYYSESVDFELLGRKKMVDEAMGG